MVPSLFLFFVFNKRDGGGELLWDCQNKGIKKKPPKLQMHQEPLFFNRDFLKRQKDIMLRTVF